MKEALTLRTPERPALCLRAAGVDDAERLRIWKNANRQYFFFRDEISPEQQRAWMTGYRERPHDYMFIVEHDGEAVACLGFRLIGGKADVYNVIQGNPALRGQGTMSIAIRLMLSFARGIVRDVGLKILKENPAVRFYERNGFVITVDQGDHLEMTLDWARFQPVEVT